MSLRFRIKRLGIGDGSIWFVCLCVLILSTGCRKLPEAAVADDLRRAGCTFWRNDGESMHLMGGGVFIGYIDKWKQRVFCLTARHVMTMFLGIGTCGRFYKYPRRMVIVLEGEGSYFWKNEISPERWMTGEFAHDLSWFELSAGEIEAINHYGSGIIVIGENAENGLCTSKKKGFISGTTAIGQTASEHAKVGKNSEVWMQVPRWHNLSLHELSWTNGIMNGNTGLMLDMHYPMSISMRDIGIGMSSSQITMQQMLIKTYAAKGNSGTPVFANLYMTNEVYRLLVGVLSVNTNKHSCAMPLDDVIEKIRSGKGRRLVDLPDFI